MDQVKPIAGLSLTVPLPRHPWRGPVALSQITTFRHWELSFKLQVQSPKPHPCLQSAPLLEILTTGLTRHGEYFNASVRLHLEGVWEWLQREGVLANGLAEVRDAMIRPLVGVWVTPPSSAKRKPKSAAASGAVACGLAVVLDIKDYPFSEVVECFSFKDALFGREPSAVSISFTHDNTIVVKVDGDTHAQCGPYSDSFSLQRNAQVYLGSRFYHEGLPKSLGMTGLTYGLMGPAGLYAPHLAQDRARAAAATDRIPRIIHQVWLGSNEPRVLTDSWRAYALFSPSEDGWEHRMWRSEAAIAKVLFEEGDELLRQLRPMYELEPSAAGRSDFLRFALLYAFGGVYVDADSLWLGPPSALDPLLEGATFAAAWEDKRSLLVATGILASVPGGRVVRRVLQTQIQLYHHCRMDLERKPWDPLALGALTNLISIEFSKDPLVRILPHSAFYSYPHYLHPWKAHGRGLPSLRSSIEGEVVSVDLGLSTNSLDVRIFTHGDLAMVARQIKRRLQLVAAWQSSVQDGLQACAERALSAGLAFPYLHHSWSSRLPGFPKTFDYGGSPRR